VIANELLVTTDSTGTRGVHTVGEAVDTALERHQGRLGDGLDINILRLVPRLTITEKKRNYEK
jgi:hypothetical protein